MKTRQMLTNIFSFAAAAALLTAAAGAAPLESRGDLNQDGQVNVVDAVMLARLNAEDRTLENSDALREYADCNGDGSVDELDLSVMLRHLAGKTNMHAEPDAGGEAGTTATSVIGSTTTTTETRLTWNSNYSAPVIFDTTTETTTDTTDTADTTTATRLTWNSNYSEQVTFDTTTETTTGTTNTTTGFCTDCPEHSSTTYVLTSDVFPSQTYAAIAMEYELSAIPVAPTGDFELLPAAQEIEPGVWQLSTEGSAAAWHLEYGYYCKSCKTLQVNVYRLHMESVVPLPVQTAIFTVPKSMEGLKRVEIAGQDFYDQWEYNEMIPDGSGDGRHYLGVTLMPECGNCDHNSAQHEVTVNCEYRLHDALQPIPKEAKVIGHTSAEGDGIYYDPADGCWHVLLATPCEKVTVPAMSLREDKTLWIMMRSVDDPEGAQYMEIVLDLPQSVFDEAAVCELHRYTVQPEDWSDEEEIVISLWSPVA